MIVKLISTITGHELKSEESNDSMGKTTKDGCVIVNEGQEEEQNKHNTIVSDPVILEQRYSANDSTKEELTQTLQVEAAVGSKVSECLGGSTPRDMHAQFGIKSFQVSEVPAGILAYMGDSVYEIIIRNFLIQRGYWDSHKIHRQSIQFVNAGAQAELLRYLEPKLTEDEKIVLRRARNSNAGNVPRNAKVSDYRYSTAFEAILGYLVIKGDLARFAELKIMIEEYLAQKISGK